jgi:hypothetical protein
LEETSITNATNLVEASIVNDPLMQEQKSKLEKELSSKRIISKDKKKMAFIGEVLQLFHVRLYATKCCL